MESKKENIKLVDTAIEVYKFINDMPSPLNEFVFKTIVENAYENVSFLPIDKAKEQLVDAICKYMSYDADLIPIYEYLDILSKYKEIDKHIIEVTEAEGNEKKEKINKLKKYFLENCDFKVLPSKDLLIQAQKCFSPGYVDLDYDSVRSKIINKIDECPQNKDCKKTIFDDCFQELGYKTFFQNIYNPDAAYYIETFKYWYCKGNILKVVLDTIYKCNYKIAEELWLHVQKKCENNQNLKTAFDECRRTYRDANASSVLKNVAASENDCESDKDTLVALDKIYISKLTGKNIIEPTRDVADEKKLGELVKFLLRNEEIDPCDVEKFKTVFSGQKTSKIKWKGKAVTLADLLRCTRKCSKKDNWKDKTKYIEQAARIFLNFKKNNVPFKVGTLSQTSHTVGDNGVDLIFKKFKEIGIIIDEKNGQK